MKTGVVHVVPLSDRAMEILDTVGGEARTSGFVFTGTNGKTPLSEMALTMVMRGLLNDGRHATVHGFRSSFRDWAGDATNFPRDLAEAALSHKLGSDVEAAYRRGTAIEKRRAMMEAWARFLDGEPVDNVVSLTRRA